MSSATLTPKPIRVAPASISLITREQIARMPYRYLHELLNHVPGFQSFRQGEAGDEYYHSARGRRVGTASREVLILIDGIRFNRETDNAQGVPSLSLDNIESIELIRGPGSALYGSNAFTGVISITTLKTGGKTTVGVSDLGTATLSANLPYEQSNWSAHGHVYLEQDPGQNYWLESNFTQERERAKDAGRKGDLYFVLSGQQTSLSLMHFYRKSSDFYVIENLHSRNQTENSFSAAALKKSLQLHQNWNLDLDLTLTRSRYDPKTIFAPAGFAEPADQPLKVDAHQRETARLFQFLNDWTLSGWQSLQLGGEYRHLDQESLDIFGNFDLSTYPATYVGDTFSAITQISPGAREEIFGTFLQYQLKPAAAVDITLGVRYDKYPQLDPAYSPRAALVCQVHEQHTVKLLYGEAFRSPTANERRFTGNATVVGNPQLAAEKIQTSELVWLYTADQIALNFGFFHSRIDDAIEQQFIGTTRTFDNAPNSAEFSGYETELVWNPLPHWNGVLNFSRLRNLPGSQFRQADEFGSLQLNYSGERWNWNLSGHFAGDRSIQTIGQYQTLDSYSLIASKVSLQLFRSHKLSLSVTNLLDKEYLTPTQGQALNQGIPNRGREVFFAYEFAL